jgi:ribonuclease HII
VACDVRDRGPLLVCGVDEVGRGALFGPVVAGAVVPAPALAGLGITDSKKLSPRRRESLSRPIYTHARACAIGWCWNDDIDEINIWRATQRAMRMAVAKLPETPHLVLVDGPWAGFFDVPSRAVVGGDASQLEIAAASIIAKVFRDELLRQFAPHFPGYGLDKNKGYPTQFHRSVLSSLGMTLFHRQSFGNQP